VPVRPPRGVARLEGLAPGLARDRAHGLRIGRDRLAAEAPGDDAVLGIGARFLADEFGDIGRTEYLQNRDDILAALVRR